MRPLRARGLRLLEVVATEAITPLMRRVKLGGAEFDGLPDGPTVKLLIPPVGKFVVFPEQDERRRLIWAEAGIRPTARTYSVRHIDRAAGTLDIDFVMHGHGGVAAQWARDARPGDPVGVGGPSGRELKPAAFYLFAGDHSALPAIARHLEQLPGDARGHAFIEVPDETEQQALRKPAGVAITWLFRGDAPAGTTMLLVDAVLRMIWPAAAPVYAWISGESTVVRALRKYARDRQLDRTMIMAIGYWKLGMSEDAYHDAHDHDRDADYHLVAKQEEIGRRGQQVG